MAALQKLRNLICFTFEDKAFPLEPKTAFYDYIYMNALLENENLAQMILQYDAFTDIEFNPDKSLNCQAKAAAAFVALSRMGLIERVKDFESFLKLNHLSSLVNDSQPQKEKSRTSIALDVDKKSAEKMNLTDKEWLIHKTYGILTTIWRNCLE